MRAWACAAANHRGARRSEAITPRARIIPTLDANHAQRVHACSILLRALLHVEAENVDRIERTVAHKLAALVHKPARVVIGARVLCRRSADAARVDGRVEAIASRADELVRSDLLDYARSKGNPLVQRRVGLSRRPRSVAAAAFVAKFPSAARTHFQSVARAPSVVVCLRSASDCSSVGDRHHDDRVAPVADACDRVHAVQQRLGPLHVQRTALFGGIEPRAFILGRIPVGCVHLIAEAHLLHLLEPAVVTPVVHERQDEPQVALRRLRDDVVEADGHLLADAVRGVQAGVPGPRAHDGHPE
eukprot:6135176-Prymnesium_polylepis.3